MKSIHTSLSLVIFCIFLVSSQATNDAVTENGMKRMLQNSRPPSCFRRCGGGCARCEAVPVQVGPGEIVWRCECAKERMLQGSAPPSCFRRCGGCTPCVRVSVEVMPGDYVWKCECKP